LSLTSPGVMLVAAPQEEDHPEQLTSLEACMGWPWIPPTEAQAGDQGREHHEQTMLRPVLISRVSSFLLRDLQERVLYGSLTCCWPSCVNTDTGAGPWRRLLWGRHHNHLPSSHCPHSPALHQRPEISLSHRRNVLFVLPLRLRLGTSRRT